MSKDVSAEIGFTFEAVLDAVQDSARGRWFLEELKRRSGQQDLAPLMDAINRIEGRVEGMAAHFTAAEDLAKVRQAIARTRGDIQKLQPETKGLSEEGRLFAHLAELARKSIPAEQNGAGIEQALRLVDQIDLSLGNNNVMAFPSTNAKSSDKFFQQDAAVFEDKQVVAPPAPKLVAAVTAVAPAEKPVAAAAKPAVETPPTGAKLTITRVGQASTSSSMPAAEAAAPAEAELAAAEQPTPEAKTQPSAAQETETTAKAETIAPEAASVTSSELSKPRIVIIRRKPEEIPEVPAALAAPAA